MNKSGAIEIRALLTAVALSAGAVTEVNRTAGTVIAA
jgi:hypothetical protein